MRKEKEEIGYIQFAFGGKEPVRNIFQSCRTLWNKTEESSLACFYVTAKDLIKTK